MSAETLFAGLLASYERAGGKPSRRIGLEYKPPADPDAREAMKRAVLAAERAGAVTVARGKGFNAHTLERVYLGAPDRLYEITGRIAPDLRARQALDCLESGANPVTEAGREALRAFMDATAAGRTLCGIGPWESERAIETVAVIDAVIGRDPADSAPLRSFSASRFGDSKLVGKSWRRCCTLLRHLALAGNDEDDESLALRFGLRRHVPLVCVAGPLRAPGADLSGLGPVGLTGQVARTLVPAGPLNAALTVENWESFCRHAEEARRDDEVVIYTGGWPSHAVVAALSNLSAVPGCRFYHWGDIDPAGVRIAHAVGEACGGALPHLMSPELAADHGTPMDGNVRPPVLPSESPFATLAEFLSSKEARTLEQEVLDPVPLPRDG